MPNPDTPLCHILLYTYHCTNLLQAAGEVMRQLQLQEELCPQTGRAVFLSGRQALVKLYGNKREAETGPSEAQPDEETQLYLMAPEPAENTVDA